MEFWLSWQNNTERFQLPVPPSNYSIDNKNINSVININEIGEVNMIGKSGLREISIDSFFPNREYYFCKTTPLAPYDYINMILKWKESQKPIRLIITDTPINIAAAIESFEYGEKDGTGDVYYSLGLKEYRFVNVSTKREVKAIPDKYIVRDSDTLWKISKATTGSGDNYKKIAKNNNIRDFSNVKKGDSIIIGNIVVSEV